MRTDRIYMNVIWHEASRKIFDKIRKYKENHHSSDEEVTAMLNVSRNSFFGIIYGEPNCSYSAAEYIESKLGLNLKTLKSIIHRYSILFNSSQSSGFVYKIVGCNKYGMYNINSKDSLKAIISTIKKDYALEYVGCRNDIFKQNLCMVDSRMDEILQNAILIQVGYLEGLNSPAIPAISKALAKLNPIDVRNPDVFYKAKMKALLFASFAGMTASTEWDGRKMLTGGYIDVNKEGEMLYYRAMSDDIFENYLFKHTYIDRPDRGPNKNLAVAVAKAYIEEKRDLTEEERNKIIYKNGKNGEKKNKKEDFGYVYQDKDDFYIVLNFKIRFK